MAKKESKTKNKKEVVEETQVTEIPEKEPIQQADEPKTEEPKTLPPENDKDDYDKRYLFLLIALVIAVVLSGYYLFSLMKESPTNESSAVFFIQNNAL